MTFAKDHADGTFRTGPRPPPHWWPLVCSIQNSKYPTSKCLSWRIIQKRAAQSVD